MKSHHSDGIIADYLSYYTLYINWLGLGNSPSRRDVFLLPAKSSCPVSLPQPLPAAAAKVRVRCSCGLTPRTRLNAELNA